MNDHGSPRLRNGSPRPARSPLHRTPLHQQVLGWVLEGRIEWCSSTGISGGFVPAGGGAPFQPSAELVALYELRNAGLIEVSATTGRVTVTPAGMARLAQWASWQRGKAS